MTITCEDLANQIANLDTGVLVSLPQENISALAQFAVFCQDEKILSKIIQGSKYDINRKDADGNTLLHYAVLTENLGMIKPFYQTKAEDNSLAENITLMKTQGNYFMVSYLISELYADINAKNSYGATPTHLAALKTHLAVLNVLAVNKANLGEIDNNGYTPIDYAFKRDLAPFPAQNSEDCSLSSVVNLIKNGVKPLTKVDEAAKNCITNTINQYINSKYAAEMCEHVRFVCDNFVQLTCDKDLIGDCLSLEKDEL